MDVSKINGDKKPPGPGLLSFFKKQTKIASDCKDIISISDNESNVSDLESKTVIKTSETDKENRKENKLVVKMKSNSSSKKKRKKVESSDEEDLEELFSKKKKVKKISPGSSPSKSDNNLDIENIVKVPRTDMTIDISDDTADEVEAISESAPVEVAKETIEEDVIEVVTKPKKSISSFFSKVTKEDRLKKVEKENNQVEVKVLVHTSPDAKSRESSSSPEMQSETTKTRKSRRSNVSRSAAETEKIEVVHVDEIKEDVKENVKEDDVVEMELDASENAESATRKISNKLFTTKSKRRSSQENVDKNDDDSDASVNMESLENTPVKNPQCSTKSSLKKVPVTANQEIKSVSAFSVLMNKKKNALAVEASEDCEKVVKENASPISDQTKAVFNNAFNTLMKNSRKSFEPPPPEPEESQEEANTGIVPNLDQSVVIVDSSLQTIQATHEINFSCFLVFE